MFRLPEFDNGEALSPKAIEIAKKLVKTKEGALYLLGEYQKWKISARKPNTIKFCHAGITVQIEKTHQGLFYYEIWVDQPYMVVSDGECARIYDAKRAVKRELKKLAEDFRIAGALLDSYSGSEKPR